MKKSLLILAAAAMACSSASAQLSEPLWGNNLMVSAISSNGKWAVSYSQEVTSVVNLETLDILHFVNYHDMQPGIGPNTISDDGVVAVSTTFSGTAAYIQGEDVVELPVPAEIGSSFANVITPDGSRIAGTIGIEMTMDAHQIMQRPVIWERKADGTYGDPIELPHPATDMFGGIPQYILVDAISEDGKVIGCQVHDANGWLNQPLVIREGEDGKWTYEEFGLDLINTSGEPLPQHPGIEPKAEDYMTAEEKAAFEEAVDNAEDLKQPEPKDFMTEEEIAAYDAAYAAYMEDYYNNPIPVITTFMTQEEKEAYLTAETEYWKNKYPVAENFLSPEEKEAYEAAKAAWDERNDAFSDAYWTIMQEGVIFEMNVFVMSPNGKYYAATGTDPKNIDLETFSQPMSGFIFDTDGGKLLSEMKIPAVSVTPSFITNDGQVLAYKPYDMWGSTVASMAIQGYYAASIKDEFIPLQEYIKEKDADLYSWMEQTMHHQFEIEGWDWELEEPTYEQVDLWVTGAPVADKDLCTIGTYAINFWDMSDDAPATYSYFFSPAGANHSGIAPMTKADSLSVKMDANGNIIVNGDATAVEVFDITGRCVFSAANVSGVVSTGLGKGIYVVKASNGAAKATAKVLR